MDHKNCCNTGPYDMMIQLQITMSSFPVPLWHHELLWISFNACLPMFVCVQACNWHQTLVWQSICHYLHPCSLATRLILGASIAVNCCMPMYLYANEQAIISRNKQAINESRLQHFWTMQLLCSCKEPSSQESFSCCLCSQSYTLDRQCEAT